MIKIALFAAVQVVMYLLVAYKAWDLAWVLDRNIFNWPLMSVWWFLTSLLAIPFFVEGEQNDD